VCSGQLPSNHHLRVIIFFLLSSASTLTPPIPAPLHHTAAALEPICQRVCSCCCCCCWCCSVTVCQGLLRPSSLPDLPAAVAHCVGQSSDQVCTSCTHMCCQPEAGAHCRVQLQQGHLQADTGVVCGVQDTGQQLVRVCILGMLVSMMRVLRETSVHTRPCITVVALAC
jgi:hypothetical protein